MKKTKKELLEDIEVLKIEVSNLREIIKDQNAYILMLYVMVEDQIK